MHWGIRTICETLFLEALAVTSSRLVSLEMGARRQAPDGTHGDLIMGGSCPTGAEQDRPTVEGWMVLGKGRWVGVAGGLDQTGTVGPGQAQQPPLLFCVPVRSPLL